MHLNANFNQPALIQTSEISWQSSPMAGVERKMLDRIGEEKARATSLVRYAPGSHFKPHVHTGGEEFLVLDGVFQDEHGDYPAGSYLRNPPQSSHTPGSESGCIIFVKLWQFDPDDRQSVRIQSKHIEWQPHQHDSRIKFKPLFQDNHETVNLEQWPPGITIERKVTEGLELLVLNGSFKYKRELLQKWSWLRLPKGSHLCAETNDKPCTLWVKYANHRVIAPA